MNLDAIAIKRAKHYNKAEGLLLQALIDVDRHRVYEKFGYTHLTPYCVKRLKLNESVVGAMVRVIRRSHHVPELASAVMKEEVSLFKAKVIASVITSENKEEWIKKASTLSKSDLEKQVASAGGLEVTPRTYYFSLEELAHIRRNQEILATKRGAMVSEGETIVWALSENLKRFDPLEKAQRSQGRSVNKQVVLRDEERCQWIYEDGSQCEERKWLHQHHIIHRADGGPDTLENLVTLCSGHHRMIHREH